MGERITKGDVETACVRLNAAARRLRMDRKFVVHFGSGVMGVQHNLEEPSPSLTHPAVTPIGWTYAEAERYLNGMRHALESFERDRQHLGCLMPEGKGPQNSVGCVY